MPALDVYTPWQENAEDLAARTVAREELLAQLVRSMDQVAAGQSALPVYLFGPRGCGKSHVLSLLRARSGTLPVLYLPEDIPPVGTAEELYSRLARLVSAVPAWRSRGAPIELPKRCVLLVEALHKHLSALPLTERRILRARMEENQGQWWVASGVGLVDALTQKDEPLYGHFSPHPLAALSPDEATMLLERQVPELVTRAVSWPGRSKTLVLLGGGSPRTLLALADACAAAPEAWASDHLHTVIRAFTAHYQMRFANLSRDGQRVVELLSASPRELGPTELAFEMGVSPAHASKVLTRLADDGVLTSRARGRNTDYTLAEPLFRYWYEYRTASWDESRIGWVARLVEAVLSPEEMARAWATSRDTSVGEAIGAIVEREPRKALQLIAHLLGAGGDPEDTVRGLCAHIGKADPRRLLEVAGVPNLSSPLRKALRPAFQQASLELVEDVWQFEASVGSSPAAAFRRLVTALSAKVSRGPAVGWAWTDARVRRALDLVEQRGAGWVLDPDERARLSTIPFLRARYLRHGKRPGDPGLITGDDLLAQGTPALDVDWDVLVAAAHQTGSEALWCLLVTRGAGIAPRALPVNPRPQRGVPALAETWMAVVARSVRAEKTPTATALTWLGSAAELPEPAFEVLVDALATGGDVAPRPHQVHAVDTALLALAREAPARIAGLEPLLVRHGWLEASLARAAAAAEAMRGESLHPELRALADLFTRATG